MEFLALDFVVLPANIAPVTTQGSNRLSKFFRIGLCAFAILNTLLIARTANASIIITTIDASSGKPLSEVQVVLGTSGTSQKGTTDSEGKCKLEGTDLASAHISVQKEGWCPMQWDFAENQPSNSSDFSIEVRRAATIGGSVVDSAGKGISGVRVFITFPQKLWGAHIPVEDLPVISDAEGRWKANFVPGDVAYIHLQLIHPNYVWEESQPSRVTLTNGHAVLKMKEILALKGRVLDPAHQPVAGASVFRGQQWGIMGLQDGNEVRTDTNGGFSFPADKAGKMQVAAFAPGFGPVIKEVELIPNGAPIEFLLTTPHIRKIRVTDLDGKPLPNLKVRVAKWQSFSYPPWELTTDSEGRILITNAPNDELQMDFLAPHRMGLRFHRVAASESEQVVQLGPELRLHGKVTDALTGKPVPSFKVTPGWPRQVFSNGQLTNQGAEWGMAHQTKSFHGGTYDMTFTEPIISGMEKPSDFLLRVEAEDYAPAVSRAFKATEKDAEFDFQLAAPAYIHGTVHFADGTPAAGAKIYLVNQTWDLNALNGKIQNMRNLPVQTADSDGQFKLMEQQAPPVLIVWHENGFATMEFADFQKTNQITLTKWGRIEGTLRRGNRVAAHETVALGFETTMRQDGRRRTIANPNVFNRYETTTDDSGRFVFDKVPPGETAITRVESIPRPMGYGLPLGDVWAGCRLLVVRVPEGGTVSVEAGAIGRSVVGRFISTNDFSRCIATLTRSVPPVPYPEALDATEKKKWAEEWFWSAGAEQYRIWLRGTPQSDVPMSPDRSWAVKVGKNGEFEIDDVPAGTYSLQASFMSPGETGRFGMRPPNISSEIGRLTNAFTVPPGDKLAEMPPLELGTIGTSRTNLEFPVAAPSAHEPVTVAMKTDHAEANPGEIFQVIVRVRITEGHHIFAATPKSQSFTGTSVSLVLPPGVEAVSDWYEPAITLAPDGERVFTNSVSYSRSFKLGNAAVAGPISLTGELHYQACNERLCWPPKTIPISTTIIVRQPSGGTQ